MPEGPEIFLASLFINTVSQNRLYGGRVVKSEISTKNPDVEWEEDVYRIHSVSRGKELKVTLCQGEVEEKGEKTLDIIFRFGMSGSFKFTPVQEMPKHAHLRFFTINKDVPMVLCFVDYRRFGRWEVRGTWGRDRGPDPMWEYPNFRENILAGLKSAAFNKPICEALLNQKYFNGIGNYLRAEILYRCGIRPFDEAREVLSEIKPFSKWHEMQSKLKADEVCEVKPDILDFCHILPKEVIHLSGGGKGYNVDPDADEDEYAEFLEWLQCYYQEGMRNMVDHNRRTIWFSGEPGRLTPKDACSRSLVKGKKMQKRKQNKSLAEEQNSVFDEDGKGIKQIKEEVEEKKRIMDKRRYKKQSEKVTKDKLDTKCTTTEGIQNEKHQKEKDQIKSISSVNKRKNTGVRVSGKVASRTTNTSVMPRAPTRQSSRLSSQ